MAQGLSLESKAKVKQKEAKLIIGQIICLKRMRWVRGRQVCQQMKTKAQKGGRA